MVDINAALVTPSGGVPEPLDNILQGSFRMLSAGGLGWSHTGDTLETTVLSLPNIIPAGAMGLNGILRITSLWSATVSDASVKTCRVKVGGIAVDRIPLTSLRSYPKQLWLQNRNVANAQIATDDNSQSFAAAASAAVDIYSIDTTVALDVIFTVQNALAADNCKLERYVIEVAYAP